MAGRKTRKVKSQTIEVPEDLEEAAKFLAEIAREQREIETVTNDLNEAVRTAQARAIEKTQRCQGRLEALLLGLFIFAEEHRESLTADGKKSVSLPTGTFGWRLAPMSVVLEKAEEELVEALESMGLGRFVRVKKTVNKEAMLEEPDAAPQVAGVSIGQGESFFVKPEEVKTQITKRVGELHAAVA